jgi:hypothetical protein
MKWFIFTLFLVTLLTTTASACSCTSSDSPEQIFRKTQAVFLGRLISIGTDEITKEGSSPLHSLTFEVEKKWKGTKGEKVKVFTNNPNMCSAFEFREGQKYLLYVRNVKEIAFVSSDCASSVEANSGVAQDRIKDLNSFWFRLKSRLWIF